MRDGYGTVRVADITAGAHVSSPPFDLTGKIAVAIGGTSGIGQAIALGLAAAGADVVATSRRADSVAAIADRIEGLGRRTLRVPTDVADRGSLQRLLEACVAGLGRVDILVNCAGRTKRCATLDVAEEDWDAIIGTNLTGTLRACQVFGRQMIDRRSGTIINIGSLTSFVAFHEVAAYGVSKAGVAALTQSLAIEWAPYGVRVNAIAPGVIRTALNQELLDGTPRGAELLWRIPMKRFGTVDELAGAAVFLASDAASFVTGEIIRVDGGMLASGVNQ
jgi:NAD(P)-dependent dehydrogenase (short-subunit alcohol dehydrogenase family)